MVEVIKQNYHDNIVKFKKIKKELLKILDNKCIINHIGSTAIPRMSGKNIIDILIGVYSLQELENVSNVLVNNGYYVGNSSTKRYCFLASSKEETKSGDVHLHVAIINEKIYNNFLYLRDYLLDNHKVCIEYAKVKKDILLKYGNDRKKYRKIKSNYVKKLIVEARKYHMYNLPNTLILIRHGENINNLTLDNNNLPLSDKGRKQALNVKKKLTNSFNIIITSPSLRCKETANIINGDIPYIIDERILEKGYGNKKHDGNESIFETTIRFTEFLNDLKKYRNQKVLVITHGGLIRLAENIIEEKNPKRKHIDNCDFIKYEKNSTDSSKYYKCFFSEKTSS